MVDTLRISVGKQLGVSRHRIKLLREGQAQYESFAMTAWVDYWWLVWFCFEREVVGVEMNEFWWTTESSQFLDQVLNNSSTVRHGHANKMMNSWRCGPFSQSTDLLVRQSDNHVFVVFCQEETCTNQDELHFLVGKMLGCCFWHDFLRDALKSWNLPAGSLVWKMAMYWQRLSSHLSMLLWVVPGILELQFHDWQCAQWPSLCCFEAFKVNFWVSLKSFLLLRCWLFQGWNQGTRWGWEF